MITKPVYPIVRILETWWIVNRDFFNNMEQVWRGMPYVSAIFFFYTEKSKVGFHKEIYKVATKYFKQGRREAIIKHQNEQTN